MTSPRAPVGAKTDLQRRARLLQTGWERLLVDGALGPELSPEATAGLRPTIVESWRRSLATGLDPTDALAPIVADPSEVLARWFEHPLGSLSHVLAEQLRQLAEESGGIVVVTDASGLVLHRVGDERLKERAAEMNLVEGARYSEAADGTNGIGTALSADQAFQVFAFEHFNERHHGWICSGAPVHDPVSGHTIGLIDLSNLWQNAHPRNMDLVTAAVRTIERSLAEARHDADDRLRRRYSDLMTRSTDLLVDRAGHVLDGAEPAHADPFDIPEGGGEVRLEDGSVVVAASLGRGEAYLLRQRTTDRATTSQAVRGLERAEVRARELATEQSALRQVATLVARESAPDQLFSAVAEQVAGVFAIPHVRLVRYEPEGSVVVGGFSDGNRELFPIGSRWPLDASGVMATVRRTGRPARVEDYARVTGEAAAHARDAGLRSAVACPIVVDRRLWGAMVVYSLRPEPFPESTEARLTDFTELVATAIANAEAREALARLADEQAALRRVATLVAKDAAPAEIFAAVSAEVDRVFGLDPATGEVAAVSRFGPGPEYEVVGISKKIDYIPLGSRWTYEDLYAPTHVRRTGRSARIRVADVMSADGDIAESLRQHDYLSEVACPILVDGRLWGAMSVDGGNDFPPDAEQRLERFTELVATAIANAESRKERAQLADEQAALRRVATLVAKKEDLPEKVFAKVAEETGRFLGGAECTLLHSERDGAATNVGTWGERISGVFPIGTRFSPDGDGVAATVLRTGHPHRIDDYSAVADPIARSARDRGIESSVGCAIVVRGAIWGAIVVGTTGAEPFPPETEMRLTQFADLVATAVANAEARGEIVRLGEEQAALRRVATLVARAAPSTEVFEAVATEVGKLLDSDVTVVGRYDGDGSATAIGSWSASGAGVPVGTRSAIGGHNVMTIVAETGKPARMDGYDDASGEAAEIARRFGWRCSIAAPIVVEGRLWGVMLVATERPEAFPAAAEERLAAFTELVATAVGNTEARHTLERVAAEQAALRRVATLVARGASPQDLFDAVVEEIGRLLLAANVSMGRYEPDDTVTSMASWSATGPVFTPGERWPIKGTNVAWMVLQTGRPARIDDFSGATDPIGVAVREAGFTSAIGSPIVVEGYLWGAISAASTEGPMPSGSEARLASFTELVATAIANAESSEELAASRRRIVAAWDDARRRIERDLHDGVQQRLVSLGLELGAMRVDPPTGDALTEQLAGVTEDVGSVLESLVETARGIHPAILSQGGLAAAIKALARRSAVPVEVLAKVDGPLPDDVEVAAYYVAAETLTNAAKHARASVVQVGVTTDDGALTLMVRDDGVGGADRGGGSGLVGLHDRVEALGGTVQIESPAGSGTSVLVTLPIAEEPAPGIEGFLPPPKEAESPSGAT